MLSSDLSSKISLTDSTSEQTFPLPSSGCNISMFTKVRVPAVYVEASAEASNSTSLPPAKSLNKMFNISPVAPFLKSAISPSTPSASQSSVAPITVAFLRVNLPGADPSGPSISKP